MSILILYLYFHSQTLWITFPEGFVTVYRFLVKSSESGLVSALAWLGLAATILTASTLVILQTVDGISLKRAVDSWAAAPQQEKVVAFRVAEGIRWTEIGLASMFRILQGVTAIIFGVAIAIKRGDFSKVGRRNWSVCRHFNHE